MYLTLQLGIVIIAICLGYIIGLIQGGVKIYRYENTNNTDKIEMNDSGIDSIDPEIRQYYEQNHGMNKY